MGFVEGKGTFGYKSLVPYFQIAQHSRELNLLNIIKFFLESLKPLSALSVPNLTLKINRVLNKRTNVYSYIISDLDVLFHIIIPFFSNLEFKTRKLVDFKLWIIAIKLHIYGYYLLPEGKFLLLIIVNSSNKARYGNNIILPDESKINNLFKLKAPFDFNSGKSYTILAQEYAKAKGSRTGFEVYVYKNNKFIGHFHSYSQAQKEFSLKSNKTISRLIDTDKVSKVYGYKFYSKPI